MKKALLFLLLLIAARNTYAQFHYKGLQGAFLEMDITAPIAKDSDARYSAGYSKFIGRKWQLMFNGEYATSSYNYSQSYQYYNFNNHYKTETYALYASLKFSFLRIGKYIYLNAGLGPGVAVQRFKELEGYNSYTIDYDRYVAREQRHEPDPKIVRRKDAALRAGGIGYLGTEIYLNRYFNLLYRYNITGIVKSNLDTWNDYQLIGLRYNFR
ncbi:hypothetical protein [Cesiribacter sp. SM1]|uniref:hypothetical protein n=1 Tax=Cesiribacter sp. SM1 TaxID=2861196 RepID=UPI001CD6942E|nr:hypothetical protein [Cesiribacter sp. SM1]